jgi:tight adherence protein C
MDFSMVAGLLPVAAFLGVGLLVLLVGRVLFGLGRSQDPAELSSRAPRPVFGPLTPALAGMLPQSAEQQATLDRDLKRAGYYRPQARQQFLAIRNGLMAGWTLLTGTALVALFEPVNDPTRWILIVGAVVLLLLYATPRLWLASQANQRVQRIELGLPDALDMITMCLSGGLPLQQSLERVGSELRGTHSDLAFELEIVRRHAETHTLEYGLSQFSERIDAAEIRSLTSLVADTERLGTNVAAALRDYADSVRRGYRQRAEELGNKNSVKLLLPVSLCLAPPVYILLLAPAVLELRDFMVRENRPGGVLAPADPNETLRRAAGAPVPAGAAGPLGVSR